MNLLDMTGKPCPIPVVQAKKLLAQPDVTEVAVLVDNIIAVQNLEKMAVGLQYTFQYEQQKEDLYRVQLQKNAKTSTPAPQAGLDETAAAVAPVCTPIAEGPTVLIGSNTMGNGAEELGRILMKGFIFSLTELSPPPKAVIFINSGAHLTTEGSSVLTDLQTLADRQVEILTCGTCANYYGLTEALAVGVITDMMGITTRLAAAQKLITL